MNQNQQIGRLSVTERCTPTPDGLSHSALLYFDILEVTFLASIYILALMTLIIWIYFDFMAVELSKKCEMSE